MVNINRILEEFLALVRVDSESGKEREMADLVLAKLSGMGLKAREDSAGAKIGTGVGNIIARLPGNRSGAPCLLLNAHLDTVKPGQGIWPLIKNDIICSAGDTILGADDKAGVVAILEALRVLLENPDLPRGDLLAVFTVYEEGGLLGSANIDAGLLQADMGLVLDCTGAPGALVIRGPSQDRIKATVHGRAAHAGIAPEEGINAIQVAARAIAAMKLGRLDGETTANIGVILGGKAINIVPDSVIMEGETRSLSEFKRIAATTAISENLRAAAAAAGTTVDIKTETIYPEMNVSPDSPVVKIATAAANRLGLEPKTAHTGGGSDAHIFNNLGIPTINLATGMRDVHTTTEHISISDLVMNARFVLEIIREAAEWPPDAKLMKQRDITCR
jgi:tripeptide aminopeptidase